MIRKLISFRPASIPAEKQDKILLDMYIGVVNEGLYGRKLREK